MKREPVPQEFLIWLSEEMRQRGLSVRELAKKGGISHTPISYMFSYQEKPSFGTCVAIAKGLDMHPYFVLVKAELISPLPSADDPAYEIGALANQLSEADREEFKQFMLYRLNRAGG